jgi:hypothetical protein
MMIQDRSLEQQAEDPIPMAAQKVSRDPPRWKLRYFAWAIALFLAIPSLLTPRAHPLAMAAALVFAVGTVLPQCFYWPFLAVERFLRTILPASLTTGLFFFNDADRPTRKRRRPRPTRAQP